jgi:hypothetical protein
LLRASLGKPLNATLVWNVVGLEAGIGGDDDEPLKLPANRALAET